MEISLNSTLFLNNFSIALKAAFLAGEEIMRIYSKPFGKKIKEDGSPITIADKNANAIIIDALKKTGIPVVSEESDIPAFEIRTNWEFYWLVDPIDGTKEFINKNDEFTVNIALIKKDKPVAGIIYAPAINKFYFGIDDLGSFLLINNSISEVFENNTEIKEIIKISTKLNPQRKAHNGFVIPVSRSHYNAKTSNFIKNTGSHSMNVELIPVGSSLKFCLLSEGICNVYPRNGKTFEWDTAAGQAIACASGGEVYDLNTLKPLRYNKQDLLNPYFIAFSDKTKSEDFFNEFL
jgi:3'(2'), 5'-bisphosphate nucleotidase